MSADVETAVANNGQLESRPFPAVIRSGYWDARQRSDWIRILPAWIASIIFHVGILILFLFVTLGNSKAGPTVEAPEGDGRIEDKASTEDLTQMDVGIIPGEDTNYNVSRIAEVSIPGPVDATANIGMKEGSDEGVLQTIPPPIGLGNKGSGGGADNPNDFGAASSLGSPGGYSGLNVPGSFGARGGSGATREQKAIEGGGTKESEAAVGRGLDWLVRHQDLTTGRWSISGFQQLAHEKSSGGKSFTCSCLNPGSEKNDTAATAMGLLPLLGAGITHRKSSAKDPKFDYTRNVQLGLKYLMNKQGADGYLGGTMYGHGLATIALCEAYALTNDRELQVHAQKALDLIIRIQHPTGGWRYDPKPTEGDTSVVAWQIMALRSGQLANLNVPKATLDGAEKFLNSVQTSNGANYKYTATDEPSPTMTAAGLLCREYLGWTPKNTGLIAGVKYLAANSPENVRSIYYQYYAMQVLHHFGGEAWVNWNAKEREFLVKTQDKANDAKHEHQKGSWSPVGDQFGASGGRLMQTSLSLLTLEVYYRHLPLYQRTTEVTKKEMMDAPGK